MRLIDADELKELIDWTFAKPPFSRKTIKHMIDMARTVDAAPVMHGRWIDETFEPWGLVHHPYKCNLCGDHAEFASPYCPNCGARMDEE